MARQLGPFSGYVDKRVRSELYEQYKSVKVTADSMPFVVRSDSENEAELVFLSPEEEPESERPPQADQGASPVLRRSNRKRKSITTYGNTDMSKNSGSKKKKGASPDPGKSMPKIPRTPQAADGQPTQQASGPQGPPPTTAAAATAGQQATTTQSASLEALLLGMEGRLSTKIDATNSKVDRALTLVGETNQALETLERRVEDTEGRVADKLTEVEGRIMNEVDKRVKTAVVDQLRAAGFDPDLTAADQSTRLSARENGFSYASAAASHQMSDTGSTLIRSTIRKKEERYNEARRSLRLWPIPNGDWQGLEGYLREKLTLPTEFVEGLRGQVELKKPREIRGKKPNEYIVTFENREDRDAVRAAAPSLASFRDDAGMKLHIPDHLQRSFRALMNLAFDLKKKHPGLKRNVKFDDVNLDLYLDVQLKADDEWQRIDPGQAVEATKGRPGRSRGIDADRLRRLLSDKDSE